MRLLLNLVDGEKIEYTTDKDSVTIGRSTKCDVVIPHESMSRQHCRIELKDGEIYITDLGSINGVYIDGVKIPASSSVPFYTYLHLAFGYVTSAQLVMDENTRPGFVNPGHKTPEGNISFQKNLSQSNNKTISKLTQPEKVEPSKVKKSHNIKSEKNTMLIKMIAFVGILVALYFLLYGNTPLGQQSQSDSEKMKLADPF